jgi:AcrR family transcriptional regulator
MSSTRIVRPYRLQRRAEAAAATRQKIIDAASELHGELGISGTSMRQIAERAGVALATLYKHFPNYGEAVAACGEQTLRQFPLPDRSIYAGIPVVARDRRVRRFIEAFFRYYEQSPWIEPLRGDALRFEQVAAFIRQLDQRIEELALLAVRRKADAALLAAVGELAVWRSLTVAGASSQSAIDTISSTAIAWLTHEPPHSRSATLPRRKR